MSTVRIDVRCDHEGCTATTNLFDPTPFDGWQRDVIPQHNQVAVVVDYCPAHAALHDSLSASA